MQFVPFVDLHAQYEVIKDEIDLVVEKVFSKCDFILGAELAEFERNFADFIGVKYAVGVSSGLDALRLSLMVLGIGNNAEVIIPANTFIATALAVSAVGATPRFVDCDMNTFNIDVNLIKSAINKSTKAIMPVHLTGQSANMDVILKIAKDYNLYVIEDVAQAHGTLYKKQCCGSFGITGCFSFYPGKNLGACGDGGIITTNDSKIAEKLQRLRNYGQSKKYEHLEMGLNARLDNLQAAILKVKLPYLQKWNNLRVSHAEKYKQLLKGTGDISFQEQVLNSTHIFHLFIIQTEKRNELQKYLTSKNIQTGIHYPKPIHLQEAYKNLGYKQGDFPNSEFLASRILSVPMFPELTDNQIEYVTSNINNFFN